MFFWCDPMGESIYLTKCREINEKKIKWEKSQFHDVFLVCYDLDLRFIN